MNKQQEVLRSKAHLVEIDLHRTGNHVLAVAEWAAKKIGAHHYLACVNRAVGERDKYDLYPSVLEERLPRIRIPLAGDDPDVPLDIQAVLEQAYEDGCYLDRIHYDRPCQPPLTKQEQVWANQMIKKAGLLPANGRRKSAPRRKR